MFLSISQCVFVIVDYGGCAMCMGTKRLGQRKVFIGDADAFMCFGQTVNAHKRRNIRDPTQPFIQGLFRVTCRDGLHLVNYAGSLRVGPVHVAG